MSNSKCIYCKLHCKKATSLVLCIGNWAAKKVGIPSIWPTKDLIIVSLMLLSVV
ncbi:hypothetical protein [Hathewaya massiliensis]|uniref:hypothetical protein n=1 Tax=Hathewaya massiliensis TaxID=1964382 RepID=UPI00163C4744|nr:hypothetical protein [Hathewaya massiliensis]